jgi:hypothetical protein
MSKWFCLCLLLATIPAGAQTPLTAQEIIDRVVARDKVLVERRKAFDFDIAITREKLNPDKTVASTERETAVIAGNHAPGYGTRPAADNPDDEAENTSREEPFEFLNIIDHYTYALQGEETVDGADCYKIAFAPKPDMPYDNREEKVLNHVSGHIWASKQDFSVIKNEGWLMHPVSVAWVFASLREMEFHFDAVRMPNGDYAPGRLMYRYLVSIPFMQLHERDTRVMSNYRLAGTPPAKK